MGAGDASKLPARGFWCGKLLENDDDASSSLRRRWNAVVDEDTRRGLRGPARPQAPQPSEREWGRREGM